MADVLTEVDDEELRRRCPESGAGTVLSLARSTLPVCRAVTHDHLHEDRAPVVVDLTAPRAHRAALAR